MARILKPPALLDLAANEWAVFLAGSWQAAVERADVIAMHFDPATKAPITLLELGLFAASGKVVVCCPPGYWRRGKVEAVCERYSVQLVGSLPELVTAVRQRLTG